MRKVIEAKGETIDSAIEKALLTLGKERDDVSVEVLQQPKSGFLGFGKEPAMVRVQYEDSPTERAKEFLDGLLYRFGTPAQMQARENLQDRVIEIELSGEHMGTVIGRRGDTLDAIQYLTNTVVNRLEDERWRVNIDTENYRGKREVTLQALAQKTAQKAIKYQKPVALEPMNAQERRIIHAALQEIEGVTTYSTGVDPNRKVIVAPGTAGENGLQPRKNNGGNRRRRGGSGRRRPASNGGASAPAAPSAAE